MKMECLNPSVKMGTMLIGVILMSFQYLVSLNSLVFAVCMLLLIFCSDAKLKTIGALLLPAFVAAAGLFFMGAYFAKGSSVTEAELSAISAMPYAIRAAMNQNIHTALQLSTRLMAFAGMGLFFSLSTDGEKFVSSLIHQCHLKPKFAYGMLAALHMLPTMMRELNTVKLAFRTRGFHVGFFSVKTTFAMMVNSVRWSESIAVAMESKGFDGENQRTYYEVCTVAWYDWVFAVSVIALIVLGMMFLSY